MNEDYTARGTARQLTFDKRVAFGPTWLSDTDLLFVAGPSIAEQRLWRMTVAGSQQRDVSRKPRRQCEQSDDCQPQNGSGARVVYERRSFDTNIWRLDPRRRLVGIAQAASNPPARTTTTRNVSPDGNQLLFGSNRSGRYEVWVSDAAAAMHGRCWERGRRSQMVARRR